MSLYVQKDHTTTQCYCKYQYTQVVHGLRLATVTLVGYDNGNQNHVKFALRTKEWVNSINHNAQCQYTHTNREKERIGSRRHGKQ